MILTETIKLEVLNNNSSFLSLLAIIIPSIVTIIGFIVNNRLTKKQVSNEILKNKKELVITQGNDVLNKVFMLFKYYLNNEIPDDFIPELFKGIYIYGSKDAIEICANYFQYCYKDSESRSEFSPYTELAYICLLLTQYKYDITGEIISPKLILKMKISDYQTNQDINEIYCLFNEFIDELKLNKKFKIEQ